VDFVHFIFAALAGLDLAQESQEKRELFEYLTFEIMWIASKLGSSVGNLFLVTDSGPSIALQTIARFLKGDNYELKMVAIQLLGTVQSDDSLFKFVTEHTDIVDCLIEGLN
jgi:hypothetical protein